MISRSPALRTRRVGSARILSVPSIPKIAQNGRSILALIYHTMVTEGMPAIRSKQLAAPRITPQKAATAISVAEAFPGVRILLVDQVAEYLNVTPRHVSDLIMFGELKGVNVGSKFSASKRRSWRVPVSALQAFMDERNGDPQETV